MRNIIGYIGAALVILGLCFNIYGAVQVWVTPMTLKLKLETYWPGTAMVMLGYVCGIYWKNTKSQLPKDNANQ